MQGDDFVSSCVVTDTNPSYFNQAEITSLCLTMYAWMAWDSNHMSIYNQGIQCYTGTNCTQLHS